MKTKIIFSGLVGLALILGSCVSSNNVVSNGLIQKRKYKKGFFFKSNADLRVVRENAKEKNSIVVNGENIEIYDGLSADISPSQDLNKSLALGKEIQATKDLIPLGMGEVSIQTKLKETNSPQFISKTKNEVRTSSREKIEQRRKIDSNSTSADDRLILLVILAILIPPLAVFLARGIGTEFWISLILTLLFYFPGMIYSLLVVLDVI
ncbi:MAG: YqaE/Pmp3 family membrane protein [Crocinitomicaceae bacterium]